MQLGLTLSSFQPACLKWLDAHLAGTNNHAMALIILSEGSKAPPQNRRPGATVQLSRQPALAGSTVLPSHSCSDACFPVQG